VVTPRRTLPSALALVALALPAGAVAKPAYTTAPGPSQDSARFTVSYKGEGSFHTTFHATPPNPGGKPDTNDAHDTSRQTWDVKYRGALTIPTCGSADPCTDLAGLDGLRGATRATGKVNHKHVDGLYRELDRTVKCKLSKAPSRKKPLAGTLSVRYIPESDSIGISASDPVQTALELFPAQCPKQGDSIDRILDFYATPGFSFADRFGPEPWFASREVVIPAAVFHDSKTIKVPLHQTGAGTPPKGCAVRDPSFERCKTGGEWNGVLTLKSAPAKASARAAARRATAAASKVKAPKSGKYSGRSAQKREVTVYVSGKAIQVIAFSFKCGATDGLTSLSDLKLKKSKKGYRFSLKAHGIVSYADGGPDENGTIEVAGRFGRTGKAAIGTFRVKTPRCGNSGAIKWSAKR
jgi:hypothetical protein